MSQRLVEVLESGWDLAVKCTACGHFERRSKDHFLTVWRKYLNAETAEIAARIMCPACGAKGVEMSEMGGTYAHFGMASQYFECRAILIRKTLTAAGLDPAAYGYPPFDVRPKVTVEPY